MYVFRVVHCTSVLPFWQLQTSLGSGGRRDVAVIECIVACQSSTSSNVITSLVDQYLLASLRPLSFKHASMSYVL